MHARKTPYAFWLAAVFALLATGVFISIPTVPRVLPYKAPPKPPLVAELRSVTAWVHESAAPAPAPAGSMTVQRGIAIELSSKLPAESLREALVIAPEVAIDWKQLTGAGTAFRVPASLKPGTRYTVSLAPRASKDARTVGKKLTLEVVRDEGALAFVRPPEVLERKSRQLVHFALTSVQALAVEALAIPAFAITERTPSAGTEADRTKLSEEWRTRRATLAKTVEGTPFAFLTADEPVLQSETFMEPGVRFTERRAALPLSWRKATRGGTLLLRAVGRDAGVAASTPFHAAQITDLALTLKSAPGELVAWVTRLSDGQPVKNAQVFLGGDGRVALAGTTDPDGLLRVSDSASLDGLRLSDGQFERAPVALRKTRRVLAVEGVDVAWADLAKDQVQVPRDAVLDVFEEANPGDIKRSLAVRAHLFTERGVYQPGDTVHVKVTARDLSGVDAHAPKGSRARVKLTVKNPRDSVVRTLEAALSSYGTAAVEVPLSRHERLGEWSIIATDTSGNERWGQASFRVEEFVAPRHQVDVDMKPTPVSEGAVASAHTRISASYRAGGPVKHGKVRWRVDLAAATMNVPGLPGYSAGSSVDAGEALEAGEATLDADGTLALDLPLPADVLAGRRALAVSATVLDFDGRAASGSSQLSHPPDYLVAISDPPPVKPGDEVELSFAVVERATGTRVDTGNLIVELLREEYATVLKRRPEGDAYTSSETVMGRAMRTDVAMVAGAAHARLSVDSLMNYQVQVSFHAPDGHMYRSTVALPQISPVQHDGDVDLDPERLPLTTDRTEYKPGQTARLLTRPSRAVTAYLVTVEREKVLSARVIRPKGDAGVIELPIEDAYAPGAHVTVMALHGREAFPTHAGELDARAPGFAYGLAPLDVRPQSGGLTLALTGAGRDATARPGATHEIGVSVLGQGKPVDAEVTLAVVDESVLALTSYQNPDLASLFLRRLPDLVTTVESRHALALQTPYKYLAVKPLTGGDGSGNPVSARRRFEPVAYFKADLKPDAQGNVRASFTLPDTMTAYRVYALAVDRGEGHGHVAGQLVVTKPLYAEVGLPRFLTAGDRGTAQVAVFNHTASAGAVSVKIVATGGLEIDAPKEPVQVPANDRTLVAVPFRALSEGPVKLSVDLSLGAERDAVVNELTVRPRYVMRVEAVDGRLEGAAEEGALPVVTDTLEPALAALTRGKVELSTLPALQLVGQLRRLLAYPYGCVEQTSSGVLPLAALRGLIRDGQVPGFTLAECDGFLEPGVQRLLGMQLSSGAFGYWPGARSAHWFGCAYATFALATAKNAGANVPAAELTSALDFLEKTVLATGKDAEDDIRAEVRALARLALVEAGRTPPPLDPEKDASPEIHALRALAARRAKRMPEAMTALSALMASITVAPLAEFDADTFFSVGRRRAMAALAALEVEPDGKIARDLLNEMTAKGEHRYSGWSTQEDAWTVLALARALRGAGKERATVEVMPPEGAQKEVVLPAAGVATVDLRGARLLDHPVIGLHRKTPGTVSWRYERTRPWAGPDAEATAPVRRSYARLDGPGPIRAGDLVRVTLDVEPPEGKSYLALDDPLPAGLVPLNRALASDAGDAQTGDETAREPEDKGAADLAPDYVELRDDRVVAFHDHALDGPRRFTWIARATCPGTFQVPPARLEPMYQPEEAVFSTAQELTIEPAASR